MHSKNLHRRLVPYYRYLQVVQRLWFVILSSLGLVGPICLPVCWSFLFSASFWASCPCTSTKYVFWEQFHIRTPFHSCMDLKGPEFAWTCFAFEVWHSYCCEYRHLRLFGGLSFSIAKQTHTQILKLQGVVWVVLKSVMVMMSTHLAERESTQLCADVSRVWCYFSWDFMLQDVARFFSFLSRWFSTPSISVAPQSTSKYRATDYGARMRTVEDRYDIVILVHFPALQPICSWITSERLILGRILHHTGTACWSRSNFLSSAKDLDILLYFMIFWSKADAGRMGRAQGWEIVHESRLRSWAFTACKGVHLHWWLCVRCFEFVHGPDLNDKKQLWDWLVLSAGFGKDIINIFLHVLSLFGERRWVAHCTVTRLWNKCKDRAGFSWNP